MTHGVDGRKAWEQQQALQGLGKYSSRYTDETACFLVSYNPSVVPFHGTIAGCFAQAPTNMPLLCHMPYLHIVTMPLLHN